MNLQRTAHLFVLQTCAMLVATTAVAQDQFRVSSPDGRNEVTVALRAGTLYYSLDRDGQAVMLPSRLGFEFREAPPLSGGLELVDTARQTTDETWT